MSRASELEEKRLSTERTDNRCESIIQELVATRDDPKLLIEEFARLMLAEATYISEQRKSGWKSRSDAHTAAGRILEQWAKDLAVYLETDKPPMRPPLETIPPPARHADLDPANGPISAQITSGLLAATGAASPAAIERIATQCRAEYVPPPGTAEGARIVRCDKRADHDDAHADWPEGSITPDAATKVRLAIEAGHKPTDDATLDAAFGPSVATSAIPAFSEPGPPPARQLQKRMTFDAVRQHGMARARGEDHRSYSQVTSFAECGVRYALSDLDAAPAWWNVGGTALHYALEAINLQRGSDTWPESFGRAISEAVAESGVTPDRWRAAKKGHEGYDWWRVEGPIMVGRWLQRLGQLLGDGWVIATIGGKLAVELSAPMTIQTSGIIGHPGPDDVIKVENILDLVMVRGDTFLIIDFKSGASAPDSTYQLGQYGWALAEAIDPDGRVQATMRIVGAYWLARTDDMRPFEMSKVDMGADLREQHPWSEIEYLITTMHVAESQGLYLPNRTRWCGSCGVAGLCPVGP